MNLAQIKTSRITKRKLFQIERAIVRELTDQWCKKKSYFSDNFAEDVDVQFKGKRIEVSFTGGHMKHGSPEATVNEMMRGLILTMTTNQVTGALLKNHEAIIGNILDVFVHRLKEIAERKFIYQRLQSLELGFSVTFGLDKKFYPVRRKRTLLEEALTLASLSTARETAEILINDILETESLTSGERGVTFHMFMAKENEASFISLPFGMKQSSYVSLLGSHTLRCNILAEMKGRKTIKSGILKVDAPTRPLSFISHKGYDLAVNEKHMMEKLGSNKIFHRSDFAPAECSFLKLLFNEYVQLASFLMSSNKIAPDLRLLIIFPRVNIFRILNEENPAVPAEEPQTLGDLAALAPLQFSIQRQGDKKKTGKSHRISEKVIQEKVVEAIQALATNILRNVYKPVSGIKRALGYYARGGYSDPRQLKTVRQMIDEISAYLKKLQQVRRVVFDKRGRNLDLAACIEADTGQGPVDALEEIVATIQAAEIEQTREVIVSKMLDYLSFITVKIEQLERVATVYIKQEVVKEMEESTSMILLQAKSYHKLMTGRTTRSVPG